MEKPFLDHLEDLRVMIFRIVVTLVVSMIACFTLQKTVMDVLRKPVENVWAVKAAEKLPDDFLVADWERAKKIEKALVYLTPEEQETFLSSATPAEKLNVKSVRLLRAAKELEGETRTKFLDQSTGGDKKLRTQLDVMIEKGADPSGDGKSDLRYLSTLKPTESFMLSMKLAFFSGIVVSFPLLLLYIFQFVLPGLHSNEKKMIWPAMTIGFGLFLLGVFFAYFVVLPRALVFFASWDESLGIGSDWRIGWYISFATQFTLLFGLSFELPVVVMVFVKLGLLSYEMMHRTRSYAVLAIVIIAAVITPTSDVVTLSLMAVPMYLLYETCIWLAWWDEKKRRKTEGEEENENMERLLLDEDEDDDKDSDEDEEDPGLHYQHDEDPDLYGTEGDEEEDSGDAPDPFSDEPPKEEEEEEFLNPHPDDETYDPAAEYFGEDSANKDLPKSVAEEDTDEEVAAEDVTEKGSDKEDSDDHSSPDEGLSDEERKRMED